MTLEEALTKPLEQIVQQTFENRKVNLLTMSHAHLSN